MANARLIFDTCDNLRASSTGSLILRQFRLYNAATPLEVGPLLSTLHNRPPSSNSASSVLVFLISLHFPSITVLRSESPLSTCPITFLCLFLIVCIRALFSWMIASTASFLCSVQLIFSILLHIYSSKASSLVTCICSFLMVHAVRPSIGPSSVFTIRFFRFLYSLRLRSSLLSENASFSIADILLITLWHLASVVIILPK